MTSPADMPSAPGPETPKPPEMPEPHGALRTALCELAGVRYPIVQTGMGWVAGPRLVAATAQAGALGFLASATMTLEQLAAAVAEVKARTNAPFGVNMRTDSADAAQRVKLLTDEGVRVASFAQAPGPELVRSLQKSGAPVIYFGTDTTALLPSMSRTGAEVIGLDWRVPLDQGWKMLAEGSAVQGNLDPVLLFADGKELRSRARDILERAAGRPGHIFNLGHGILPETPVENVKALAQFVQEHSAKATSATR